MPTQATSQKPCCVPVFGKRAKTPARSAGRGWVSSHIPTPNLNPIFTDIPNPNPNHLQPQHQHNPCLPMFTLIYNSSHPSSSSGS